MNRWRGRQVLDCASPLALSQGTRAVWSLQSGRGLPHSKTLARRCAVFLRFMGSMRAQKRKEALHEPRLWSATVSKVCVERSLS